MSDGECSEWYSERLCSCSEGCSYLAMAEYTFVWVGEDSCVYVCCVTACVSDVSDGDASAPSLGKVETMVSVCASDVNLDYCTGEASVSYGESDSVE